MVDVIRYATALPLLLALAACSDTSSDNPTGDKGSDLPACSTVWEVGATLPDPYTGCTQGGETVKPVWYDCEGGGRYAEWDEGTAYAREGGKVIDTAGELAKICD